MKYSRFDKERINESVDIILEMVCTRREAVRIARDNYPAELVKSKQLRYSVKYRPKSFLLYGCNPPVHLHAIYYNASELEHLK